MRRWRAVEEVEKNGEKGRMAGRAGSGDGAVEGWWIETGWLAGNGVKPAGSMELVENRMTGRMEVVGWFDGNGGEDEQWGVGPLWWRRWWSGAGWGMVCCHQTGWKAAVWRVAGGCLTQPPGEGEQGWSPEEAARLDAPEVLHVKRAGRLVRPGQGCSPGWSSGGGGS